MKLYLLKIFKVLAWIVLIFLLFELLQNILAGVLNLMIIFLNIAIAGFLIYIFLKFFKKQWIHHYYI